MKSLYRKSVKARELPAEWREEGRFSPDDEVTVTITPAVAGVGGSPRRFIGRGKGLFASAREVMAITDPPFTGPSAHVPGVNLAIELGQPERVKKEAVRSFEHPPAHTNLTVVSGAGPGADEDAGISSMQRLARWPLQRCGIPPTQPQDSPVL
jgi:hypothetical protein